MNKIFTRQRLSHFTHYAYSNVYVFMFSLFVLRFLLLLVLYIVYPLGYTYDEVIVDSIARQPIADILHVLQTEPYPPGYIFLLKMFPMDYQLVARMLATTIVHVGVLGALWYGKRTKILNKLSLIPGLIVFLCSYAFLIPSVYIKAEIFSMPLMMILFLAIMNIA